MEGRFKVWQYVTNSGFSVNICILGTALVLEDDDGASPTTEVVVVVRHRIIRNGSLTGGNTLDVVEVNTV